MAALEGGGLPSSGEAAHVVRTFLKAEGLVPPCGHPPPPGVEDLALVAERRALPVEPPCPVGRLLDIGGTRRIRPLEVTRGVLEGEGFLLERDPLVLEVVLRVPVGAVRARVAAVVDEVSVHGLDAAGLDAVANNAGLEVGHAVVVAGSRIAVAGATRPVEVGAGGLEVGVDAGDLSVEVADAAVEVGGGLVLRGGGGRQQ